LFIFFACPKKTNQKKRPFFLGIFCYRKNRKKAPKFFPRLQKFLTEPSSYTEEKETKPFGYEYFFSSLIFKI